MDPTPHQPADWLTLNRANWDERVPIHVAGDFYDLPGFVAGQDSLRAHEIDEVGDVRNKTLLHLQCHIGTDTLSWARRGATVTGLDFSPAAVAAATNLATQIGADTARFVTADVYDAAKALAPQTFDIVYTGTGALCWLPDIQRWAQTAAALVAPGGFLYLSEIHPLGNVLDETDGRTVAADYFSRKATVWEEGATYADRSAVLTAEVTVEWQHTLGDIVSALAAAGLRLEFLHEWDFALYPQFPDLVERDGRYRFSEGGPSVPLLFSLRAARDA